MDVLQLQEGLLYAEGNYNTEHGFSRLDKELIRKNFVLHNKEVLDFGCGMGHMSVWFANEMGANVFGVDIDENHITVAREFHRRYHVPNVSFHRQNIITDPIDQQFDFIFLNDVIEHIREDWLSHVLDVLILRNLKKGGTIFFSYPPWEGPHASHLQPATRIPWVQFLPRRYVLNLVKKRNQQLVGKNDLLAEYMSLNRMSHRKLQKLLQLYPLRKVFRKSHTKLNRLPGLKDANFNFFPFTYIVTKELIAFRKAEA